MAKDPVELTLGHGIEGTAGKGATLQQVQWGSRFGHEEHVREEEEHSGPRLPSGRHYQQPALAQEPATWGGGRAVILGQLQDQEPREQKEGEAEEMGCMCWQ